MIQRWQRTLKKVEEEVRLFSRTLEMESKKKKVTKKPTFLFQGCDVVYDQDWLGVWVGPGVVCIQTVDICHEKEVVRVDHPCGDSRERVVVSKSDLGDADGVVLVDDRDNVHLQQRVDSVARVEVLRSLYIDRMNK